MNVECGDSCGFGDNCGNKNFQFRRYAKLLVKKSPQKGLGVFANQRIEKDSFIIEYVGEFIKGKEQIVQRLAQYTKLKKNHYVLACKTNYIDATQMGNIARFINHSCEPNCRVEFWEVFRKTCVGIFAERDIGEGEELNFDYKFESYDGNLLPCYCYTNKCKGFIGKRKRSAKNAVSGSKSYEDTTIEGQNVDQREDEIERDNANIEGATIEGQNVDQRDDEIERDDLDVQPDEDDDQLGRTSTSMRPGNSGVQRATKRGRPLKKNAHKRSNKDLKEMKGRRSKNSLKILKLRLSRVDHQAATNTEDSDSD